MSSIRRFLSWWRCRGNRDEPTDPNGDNRQSNGRTNDNPNRIQYVWTDLLALGAILLATFFVSFVLNTKLDLEERTYPQIHIENIPNPLYKKENMTLEIDLVSRTFSAHEDIVLSVILWPNLNERASSALYNDEEFRKINWSSVVYRIGFANTYCQDTNGRLIRCYFDLTKNQTNLAWIVENKIIRYAVGGSHDIFLYNKTITEEQFRQGNLTSTVGKPFIQISSVDAFNSLRVAKAAFDAWKFVVTIAIIAALVGSLALYQRVRETLLRRYGEYRF